MSTSPEPSPANGHLSPAADEVTVSYANGDQSDSDLSDVQAADVDEHSPDSLDGLGATHGAAARDGFDEDSGPSDNDGSDDADFDMAESVASANSNGEPDQPASSDGSHQAQKRKAPVALEDDYMRNDPELYGLRRSVGPPHAPLVPKYSRRLVVAPATATESCTLGPPPRAIPCLPSK